MDVKGIDNLLGQMRIAAAMAAGKPSATAAAASTSSAAKSGAVAPTDFSKVLKNSIDSVSSAQTQASKLARDFELGKPNVNLQDVMVSMSKANIEFQQMVQVRNRVVAAYNDIMNMQV